MPTAPFHTPVLLREVLSLLVTAPEGIYVDATLGGAGHAEALLQHLAPGGRLIGIDADADAIAAARERLTDETGRCVLVQSDFGSFGAVLSKLRINSVNGVLFDLGVSSFQLDQGSRGFSFRADDRLDMRMDRRRPRDAEAVLREISADELTRLLKEYGEERHARRIARKIIEHRRRTPIRTTGDLAAIVREAVGQRFLTKSLARVFQSLRIAVNDELGQLERGLSEAIDLVVPGGRIVTISYHSLEDRIIKQQFKAASATSVRSETALLPDRPVEPRLKILTRKPVVASPGELARNPRARSAKLRAAERI